MFFRFSIFASLISAAALIPMASAAQIAEVKIGITEFDERTLDLGIAVQAGDENSLAINGEIVFTKPDFVKGWRLSPHPYIGGTVNLQGKTSYGGAGLLWRQGFSENFYGDLSIGFVAHTGTKAIDNFSEAINPDRETIQLGSRLLFREQIALGYNLNDNWSGELFYEHISNAWLAFHNEGADSLGARIARKL